MVKNLPKYKLYATYRPSGVEWLEEVPTHWEVKRLKYAADLNPKASEVRKLSPDTEVSFVPMEAVGEYGGLDLSLTKELSDVANGYTYFSNGDVLVAKITPCFENGKGSLASELVNGIAFGTTELHVVRCGPELDRRYAFHLTLADAFRKLGEAEMYGAGGQKRVPESFVANLRHPLPPLPEQQAIADFLGRETARIDALVAKKERLIQLLQEKRTALITRAVTRGLDPNARMKDSGVEWLGEIPAHWEVKRLKSVLARNDSGVWGSEAGNLEGTIVLRSTEQTVDGGWAISDPAKRQLSSREKAGALLAVGDIVVTKSSGSELHIGKSSLVTEGVEELQACFSNFMQRLRCLPALGSKLTWYVLNSPVGRQQLIFGSSTTTGLGNLSRTILGELVIPLPPLPEQHAIAGFLDRETAKLDALVAKVREAIKRLRELRTALISAAVAGRIDVREVATGSRS